MTVVTLPIAHEVAAQKGAKLVGRKLSADQRKKIGGAIHWSGWRVISSSAGSWTVFSISRIWPLEPSPSGEVARSAG